MVFRDDSPASIEASLSLSAVMYVEKVVEIRKFGVDGTREFVIDMMWCVYSVLLLVVTAALEKSAALSCR